MTKSRSRITGCPHFRGEIVNKAWTFNELSVLNTGVTSFQGVGLEGFHCIGIKMQDWTANNASNISSPAGGNPFGERNQLVGNKLVNDKLHGVTKGKNTNRGYLGTKVIPVSCPTTLPIHQSLLYFCVCVCVCVGGGRVCGCMRQCGLVGVCVRMRTCVHACV